MKLFKPICNFLFFPLKWTYEEVKGSDNADTAIFFWFVGIIITILYYGLPVLLIFAALKHPSMTLTLLGMLVAAMVIFIVLPVLLWNTLRRIEYEKKLLAEGNLFIFEDNLWGSVGYKPFMYFKMKAKYDGKVINCPIRKLRSFQRIEPYMQYDNPFELSSYSPSDILGRIFTYQGESWRAAKYEGYDMYWFQNLNNKRFIQVPYMYMDQYSIAKNKKNKDNV